MVGEFWRMGATPVPVTEIGRLACEMEEGGWDGLAVYKALATLIFLSAIMLLARRSPKVAGNVLVLACGVLLAVTMYTHELIRETHSARKEYGLEEEMINPQLRDHLLRLRPSERTGDVAQHPADHNQIDLGSNWYARRTEWDDIGTKRTLRSFSAHIGPCRGLDKSRLVS